MSTLTSSLQKKPNALSANCIWRTNLRPQKENRFLVLGTILCHRKVEYPAFFDGYLAHGRTVDQARNVAARLVDETVAAQNVAVTPAVALTPSPHLRLPQRIHDDAR